VKSPATTRSELNASPRDGQTAGGGVRRPLVKPSRAEAEAAVRTLIL